MRRDLHNRYRCGRSSSSGGFRCGDGVGLSQAFVAVAGRERERELGSPKAGAGRWPRQRCCGDTALTADCVHVHSFVCGFAGELLEAGVGRGWGGRGAQG
ncbi:hypothetical protein KC19_1G139100 [Ceratodon purpureus]|uniref:Uncharacterized protein n=1 Tax=Ceratodon purpureus TaxID=3225 RepID=A0A8T0J4X7_CERPU|nr:hypothetical protein KC19_1G139100 [Ceratodon purpureus]